MDGEKFCSYKEHFQVRVMVVEKRLADAGEVLECLRSAGFDASFSEADQSLEDRIRFWKPMIVLINVNVAGNRGLEICRRLSLNPTFCDQIFFVMLNVQSGIDITEVFKAGAVDYITLPVKQVELLTRLQIHISLNQCRTMLSVQDKPLLQENREHRRLEEIFERGKREWEAVVDAVEEMVILTNLHGKIIRCNRATILSLHTTYNELIGASLEDVFLDKLGVELPKLSTEPTEVHLQQQNLWFSASQYPFYVEGELQGEVYIIQDITQQARLEQMKSDFINRASHELRSPLTTALVAMNLIEQGGSEDEMKEFWGILRSELERQRILVERLLTVGRLETGNLQLRPALLNLVEVLEDSIVSVTALALSRQIEMHIHAPERLSKVLADEQALQQVFVNLLSNAIKYSHHGGTVDICLLEDQNGVWVSVQDHGIGIAKEDIPHLFTRFFRGSNAIRNEIPGTGIGLFIVKSIIEDFHGRVEVESVENEGTTFKVCLPQAVK